MNDEIKAELKKLINNEKWSEVVELMDRIPEAEWDWESIGMYIRSLNNSERAERAIEVSMRYKEQGENTARWHYHLAYAYYWLDRYAEAKPLFLRAKELLSDSADDRETSAWIDEILDTIPDAPTKYKPAPRSFF